MLHNEKGDNAEMKTESRTVALICVLLTGSLFGVRNC